MIVFKVAALLLWMAPALAQDGKYRLSGQGIEEAYLTPIFASSHAANLLQLRNGDPAMRLVLRHMGGEFRCRHRTGAAAERLIAMDEAPHGGPP
jgi:hypothetical protein